MGAMGEPRGERTPMEWFGEATRWYLQGHQGCACCHGQHCVYRSEDGPRVEYDCTAGDFSACHDVRSGRYFAERGEGEQQSGVLLGGEELWEARVRLGIRPELGRTGT